MAKCKGDRSPESQSAKVVELQQRLALALWSAKALEALAEAKAERLPKALEAPVEAEPLPKVLEGPVEAGRPVTLGDCPVVSLGTALSWLHSAPDRIREERRRSRKAESDAKRRTEAETRKGLARELYANLSSDHKARGPMHCYNKVTEQMVEILTKRKRLEERALGSKQTGPPVKVALVTVRKVYLPPAERGNG